MRDTRFRIWESQKKRMIYFDRTEFGTLSVGDCYYHLIFKEPGDFLNFCALEKPITKNEILMDYTSKKDIDNKEIYTGDILEGTVSTNEKFVCQGLKLTNMMGKKVQGLVFFSDLYAQFGFTTDGITYLNLAFGLQEYKVLGNLFQNKEYEDWQSLGFI